MSNFFQKGYRITRGEIGERDYMIMLSHELPPERSYTQYYAKPVGPPKVGGI